MFTENTLTKRQEYDALSRLYIERVKELKNEFPQGPIRKPGKLNLLEIEWENLQLPDTLEEFLEQSHAYHSKTHGYASKMAEATPKNIQHQIDQDVAALKKVLARPIPGFDEDVEKQIAAAVKLLTPLHSTRSRTLNKTIKTFETLDGLKDRVKFEEANAATAEYAAINKTLPHLKAELADAKIAFKRATLRYRVADRQFNRHYRPLINYFHADELDKKIHAAHLDPKLLSSEVPSLAPAKKAVENAVKKGAYSLSMHDGIAGAAIAGGAVLIGMGMSASQRPHRKTDGASFPDEISRRNDNTGFLNVAGVSLGATGIGILATRHTQVGKEALEWIKTQFRNPGNLGRL